VTSVLLRLSGTILAAGLALSSPADSGLHYRAQISLQTDFSVDVWVEGDRARLDVQTSNDPNLAAGTALLTADRGETLVVLIPARQEVFTLPRSVITDFKQRESQRRHITVDPISSEKIGEDAGPRLAGYPTRHLRFHLRLATHQPAAAGELTTHVDVFEHFWLAEQLTQHNTDLVMLSDSSATGVPALDEFLRGQIHDLPGFILKRNLVVTVDDSRNSHQVLRSAYEVTELSVTESPAALFEVPGDFHLRIPPRTPSSPSAATPTQPR
jgi:hypothetical protein